jgi:mannosyl-3-phosphoglycerate phosphatase family protein
MISMKNKQLIIFTDLDGTLLDASTYSFEKAKPALGIIDRNCIPLVLCSSKTRTEIEHYREKLNNCHPFISENGGGIFIPSAYFSFQPGIPGTTIGEYSVIALGAEYNELRDAIRKLKEQGFHIRGFGDMDPSEIMSVTGLSMAEANMSRERDFDEPFLFEGDHDLLQKRIEELGFRYTQGRFNHILGSSDKGKAVRILYDLFRRQFGNIFTVGLGDSLNDLPMLQTVDCPILVRKPDGSYDPRIELPNLMKAQGAGPEGWNSEILRILETGS